MVLGYLYVCCHEQPDHPLSPFRAQRSRPSDCHSLEAQGCTTLYNFTHPSSTLNPEARSSKREALVGYIVMALTHGHGGLPSLAVDESQRLLCRWETPKM